MSAIIHGLDLPKRMAIRALIYPDGRVFVRLHSGKTLDCRAVSVAPHMDDALEAVIAERWRQISLYGDQSGLPLMSWPGILGEEFGELCEAIGETTAKNRRHPERGGPENIYREACHVAAVAVQLMEAVLATQKGGGEK